MPNFTPATAFASGDVVTPTKLNEFLQNATVDASYLPTLAGLLQSYFLPAGAIMPFAMNSVPTNWKACDGSAVSRTTYAALFSAIGVLYGAGNGTTTFNLPDLRGYFLRGSGTNSDGTAAGTFGAKQADELESHSHTVNRGTTSGANFFAVSATGVTLSGSPRTSGSTGGTETRPKNIAMLFCIKV